MGHAVCVRVCVCVCGTLEEAGVSVALKARHDKEIAALKALQTQNKVEIDALGKQILPEVAQVRIALRCSKCEEICLASFCSTGLRLDMQPLSCHAPCLPCYIQHNE